MLKLARVAARQLRSQQPGVQLGTLGAGNHYAEMQIVEEIYNPAAAQKMGIDKVGQVSAPVLSCWSCSATTPEAPDPCVCPEVCGPLCAGPS